MADHSDGAGSAPESASLPEAEEAVLRAEMRAAEARAHATKLRQQAQADRDEVSSDVTRETEAADESGTPSARHSRLRNWRPRPPSQSSVGVGVAIVVITASVAASGYMIHRHMLLQREHRHVAEAASAARRGVEMMLSIDPKQARTSIPALIDSTTGELQVQLRATSAMLIADAEKAKVTTKATVQDVAVEPRAGDSAVALVVAKSDTTDADQSKRPPAYWRISVDLIRSDGQLKMSKVEFVP